MRGADRAVDIGGGAARNLRDDLTALRGCLHLEGAAVRGRDPLAADEHLLARGRRYRHVTAS